MSLKLIELNDSAIRVGDESGVILQSPGFALAQENKIELGEAAEEQARLLPTNSYNKFWHELSMEPLSAHRGIRHLADIAYAQLLHLAELGEIDADVIFAVPGNFTRQQLSIVLGLAKQGPFNPVGLVDSALLAAIAAVNSESVIYADIQLHQVVLTHLVRDSNSLKTESLIQVPGVGSQNFMDLMMQLATGLFVQQCRFNPQHNAESEQQLYNALPGWLRQDDADDSTLLLELRSSNNVYTAKMPRESLKNNLSNHYQKIVEQILALRSSENSQLILSQAISVLPGFVTSVNEISNTHVLDQEAVNSAGFEYRDHIIKAGDEIHLINSLPSSTRHKQSEPHGNAESSEGPQPSHVLFRNKARPIDSITGSIDIINAEKLNGHGAVASDLVIPAADLPRQLGRIDVQQGSIFLDSSSQELLLNEEQVKGRHKLKLGDNIKASTNGEEIRLIQVHD